MKKIFLIAAILLSIVGHGQVTKITLQAAGLTCSMCSNAINKSLKSLDFVDKVYSNIQASSFDIFIKPDQKADFDAVKSKVEKAGFSVAKFLIHVSFDSVSISNDKHLQQDNIAYHFLNTSDQILVGEKSLQIIDKGFIPAKQYKKYSKLTIMKCYKTGIAEDCCNKDNIIKGSRIYHVTI